MVEAALLATLGFATSAGVATFFAPCAYPLLPGYVGYYANAVEGESEGEAVGPGASRRRVAGALVRGLAASAGVLVTLLSLGAVVAVVGSSVARYVVLFEPVVGAGFVVLGALVLADRVPSIRVPLPSRRTSVVGFAVFGAIYALAAAGCTVPILLAIILRALSLPALSGVAVLLSYGTGIALLLLGTTVAIAVGHDVGIRRLPGLAPHAARLAGALILLAGLAQLHASVVTYDVFRAL